MKWILNLFAVTCFASSYAQTTQTMTFQPGPNNGYESTLASPYPTSTGATTTGLVAAMWTGNGTSGAWRTYFKIDMGMLPPNAIIDSAKLNLHADTNSLYGSNGKPTIGIDNAGAIYRVTSPWDKNSMNWYTQPSFTTIDNAQLVQAANERTDYMEINVTNIVRAMQTSGNYGFMMKLNQELQYYNSLIFHNASSAQSAMRPKLEVFYRLPSSQSIEATSASDSKWIQVSPNPSHDYIDVILLSSGPVNAGGNLYCTLTSITGIKILTSEFTGRSGRLFLNGISAGMYILHVEDGISHHTEKILLQ